MLTLDANCREFLKMTAGAGAAWAMPTPGFTARALYADNIGSTLYSLKEGLLDFNYALMGFKEGS